MPTPYARSHANCEFTDEIETTNETRLDHLWIGKLT